MTASSQSLIFQGLPPLWPSYLKFFLRSFSGTKGRSGPRTEAVAADVCVDRAHLARYSDLCGYLDEEYLPLPYLQVLSGPLAASVLSAPDFPVAAFGVIQTGIKITSSRAVRVNETFTMTCRAGASQESAKGLVIPMVTEAMCGGIVVWRSEVTLLSRQKCYPRLIRPQASQNITSDWHAEWDLEPEAARRYARISGDYNPVHLSSWTSRLFGFTRPIAHGMWAFSRCLAAVEFDLQRKPLNAEAVFKKAIPLPSRVRFLRERKNASLQFGLYGMDRIYLVGRVG